MPNICEDVVSTTIKKERNNKQKERQNLLQLFAHPSEEGNVVHRYSKRENKDAITQYVLGICDECYEEENRAIQYDF